MSRHCAQHLPSIIAFAHGLLRSALRPGDLALDATAGNGHDALFLAECVGEHGHIYAFDIQKQALAATQSRLQQAGLLSRVTLIADSHSNIQHHVESGLQAAVFNLGYLPGSNKMVSTQPHSTIAALQQTLDLLRPGGIIVLVVYRAHPGGLEESAALQSWIREVDPKHVSAVQYALAKHDENLPYVLALEKHRSLDNVNF